ncbi:MAG: hypothetical protein ACRC7O_06900, partial [Fimbriiglobus sp.]
VSELWFVVVLGRVGATLRNPVVVARTTRVLLLAGGLAVGWVAWRSLIADYPDEVNIQWATGVQWVKVNTEKKFEAVVASAAAALAFVSALIYGRMIGATRRAARTWGSPAGR